MPEKLAKQIPKICLYMFIGLLAYVPLHIFLSTIIGVGLSILEPAKIFKDIILCLGLGAIIIVSIKRPWFKKWIKSPIPLLIILYTVITLVIALVRPTDTDAEILGFVYNVRFLLFFLYGWILLKYFDATYIRNLAVKTVLGIGVVVVAFGLFQYYLLPDDALTHLGFVRENGVVAAFFIDDKPDLERVMSTIRDPNSLGAYLLIITSIIGAKLLLRQQQAKKWLAVYLFATLLCLYLTFSRSAWLGLILSVLTSAVLVTQSKSKQARKIISVGAVVLIIAGFIGSATLFITRDSYFVQNVIFHADETTTEETPNQLRVRFWQESVDGAVSNPIGSGPGSVGVVSSKNDTTGGRLTENYYLQLLGEVGFLGLLLFTAIVLLVVKNLYSRIGSKNNYIEIALLASLAGISFSGLLNHIWINEAVAYTWWGLAGLYMSKPKA